MADPASFRELIRRVRAGDGDAAAELVRQYEPAIRRAVRFRLARTRLGRLLDSVDICQLVMASFFYRAALGQYELNSPEQLVRLLVTMARNKLINETQKYKTQGRNLDLDVSGGDEAPQLAAAVSTPSQQVAAKELLQETLRRLSPEERRMLELRQQGCGWPDIAAQVGGTPEARRKQYDRAVERVAQELGVET